MIGAGQAGLAMGYYLKKSGLSYKILGKEKRIGDVWRERYDALTLFTPRWFSALPGLTMEGDPDGYATKDETADYMEKYANEFELTLELALEVLKVERENGSFRVKSSRSEYVARQVVVATGPFQQARIPAFAERLSEKVTQIHTSRYLNGTQLVEGPVLIVGGGNSGTQIAEELPVDRDVYLAVNRKLTFVPQKLLGKSIFWWFDKFGVYRAKKDSLLGRMVIRRGDPIIGTGLKRLIMQRKVKIKPAAVDTDGESIFFEDGSRVTVPNVVWATGFYSDFSWLQVDGACDGSGSPIHEDGVSPIDGLYFLGLPWLTCRASALIAGVGEDARRLVEMMSRS